MATKSTDKSTEAVAENETAKAEAEKIIEEAKAKAAAIVKEAREKAPAAEKKAGTGTDPEELVDYIAPLLDPKSPDILVAVNGETIRIMRGQPVRIKRKFLEVLMNAQSQEFAAYQYMQAAQKQGEQALANM